MNTPDLIAVAAIVLLAAAYLIRRTLAGQRKKTSGACAGCACGKDLLRPARGKTGRV